MQIPIFFGEPYNISLKLLYSCVFVFAKTSEIHTFWRNVRLLYHTGTGPCNLREKNGLISGWYL